MTGMGVRLIVLVIRVCCFGICNSAEQRRCSAVKCGASSKGFVQAGSG